MSKKPLIGLNADYRPLQKAGPALSYVPAGYYNCIQAAGGIPVILPPLEDEDDIAAIQVITGLTPLQLFIEAGCQAQAAKCGKFRAPTLLFGMDLTDDRIHVMPF